MNEAEVKTLSLKARKAGLSESALIRLLVQGYAPREKPDDRFYITMRQLAGLGNNCRQLAAKANALGFIDAPMLRVEMEKWNAFRMEIKRKYFAPEKVGDAPWP
jgi:hypothetical protein